MGHYEPQTVEVNTLFRDMDPRGPARFLLVGQLLPADMTLCHVYRPAQGLGVKAVGKVYMEVGRTTKIALGRLRNPRHYQRQPAPFILRKPDGSETAYG